MTRAGAPLDALLRRSPSGVGPRFPAFAPISQLLAGGRSTSGRSPDAARVRTLRRFARGRRTSTRPGIAGRRLPELGTCISGPTVRPALRARRLMSAPLSEQGANKISADSARGITFFRESYPRDSRSLASRPSQKIPLADLHAALAQNVVGRSGVEVEVRQRKVTTYCAPLSVIVFCGPIGNVTSFSAAPSISAVEKPFT